MADPSCADLFDSEMNGYYKKIEILEEKIKNSNIEDSFVVNCCVLFYQIENKEIIEIRNIMDANPLTEKEANILVNKVNKLKDLPNAEVKEYKKMIEEAISLEKSNIARLNKSF